MLTWPVPLNIALDIPLARVRAQSSSESERPWTSYIVERLKDFTKIPFFGNKASEVTPFISLCYAYV